MTIILAIDTSWGDTSIALRRDEALIAIDSWPNADNQTVELAPRIARLLDNIGVEMNRIDVFVAATGPGSFNGLRVGLAALKGFATAQGKPVIGVSTLEAEAWPHRDSNLPIASIVPLGLTEISSATFRLIDGTWQKITVEHLTNIEEIIAWIREPTIVAGDLPQSIVVRLQNNELITLKSRSAPRAAAVAELAHQHALRSDFDDVGSLQPLYLKR